MKKVYIHDFNYISPLGANAQANWEALLTYKSGIKKQPVLPNLESYFAAIISDEIINNELEAINTNLWSRIFKMAVAVLQPIIEKHHVNPQSTLIIATTKGNIRAIENNNLDHAYIPFLAEQLVSYFGFRKRPVVVSNACVSGVLALAIAKRMITFDAMNDVYVLALDEVTEFVISGFNSFQAMSLEPCKPYDKNRKGVNLGEAAAAAFVSANAPTAKSIEIIGDGSINDANHISGPSRTGEGLYQSILSAMQEAKIQSSDIDYISSHGTATIYNDEMEAITFNRLQLQQTPISSLKGYFGHTLGASGLLETLVTCQMMQNNMALANLGFSDLGVTQPINILPAHKKQIIKVALKTASGFGGSNTALLLKNINL